MLVYSQAGGKEQRVPVSREPPPPPGPRLHQPHQTDACHSRGTCGDPSPPRARVYTGFTLARSRVETLSWFILFHSEPWLRTATISCGNSPFSSSCPWSRFVLFCRRLGVPAFPGSHPESDREGPDPVPRPSTRRGPRDAEPSTASRRSCLPVALTAGPGLSPSLSPDPDR